MSERTTSAVQFAYDDELVLKELRQGETLTRSISSIIEALVAKSHLLPAGALLRAAEKRQLHGARARRGVRTVTVYVGLRPEVHSMVAALAKEEGLRIPEAMLALLWLERDARPLTELEMLRRQVAAYRVLYGDLAGGVSA